MKKRYILFGYQIQNGEFCIVQQEGAAVEYIFDAYSNGDSLQQIATHEFMRATLPFFRQPLE